MNDTKDNKQHILICCMLKCLGMFAVTVPHNCPPACLPALKNGVQQLPNQQKYESTLQKATPTLGHTAAFTKEKSWQNKLGLMQSLHRTKAQSLWVPWQDC